MSADALAPVAARTTDALAPAARTTIGRVCDMHEGDSIEPNVRELDDFLEEVRHLHAQ